MAVFALPQLSIRPLSDEAIDRAAAFLLKEWREAYRGRLSATVLASRSVGDFRNHLDARRAGCWLAWLGDRLIGLATVQSNCVDDLWVTRRYRRRGVARRLLQAATSELERRGFQFAQAGCEDFNPAAIALFSDSGWQQIGAETLYLAPGMPVDALVFSRRLAMAVSEADCDR